MKEEKQLCYISGKISGIPVSDVKINFQTAETKVKEMGFIPVNPFDLESYSLSWKENMLNDIAMLFECDCIYMQNNYLGSKGAKIELNIAKEMGLKIIYAELSPNVIINEIVRIVENEFKVNIQLKTNLKEIVVPRQIAHWLCLQTKSYYYNRFSTNTIAKIIGNKNHATILNSKKAVENSLIYPKQKEVIQKLLSKVLEFEKELNKK